jgi:2-polyprenyl-3-methyl-5-hydroxy-6-metoxy-1,4-benzoquinol methylase
MKKNSPENTVTPVIPEEQSEPVAQEVSPKTPSKIFEEPVLNCPLCGSAGLFPLHDITRYQLHFKVERCDACGFIFMNPRFTAETLRSFYGEDYYKGKAEYAYYDERGAERYARYVWDARLSFIRKFIRAGRLLDIGSAFGGFLRASVPHFEPAGIELSEYAGNYARKRMGSQIHVGTLADHYFPRDNFLVITMIEVLEHLASPAEAVKECHKLLQKGGLLVIQTANMDGLQAKIQGKNYAYYMPGHVSYFTKRNLVTLLKSAGFSRIKVYHPVEFGLLPKLRKSRGDFKSILDYRRWIRITLYHLLSKFHAGNFCTTSSMVVYAFK